MLKKFFLSVFIIYIISVPLFPEKVGKLSEVLNPYMMRVDSNILFISDQFFIYFYSINDLKMINRIGGKGEGPGLFQTEPNLKILDNNILAYDVIQFYFFQKSGEKINGNRFPKVFFSLDYVKGNFVMAQSNYFQSLKDFYIIEFVLLDSLFKEVKVIHTQKTPISKSSGKKKKNLIEPLTKFQCYKDKIYIVDGQTDLHIKVFDAQGNAITEIQKKLEKIKVTDAFKKRKYDEFINTPAIKKRWHIFKKMYECVFPEYFPDIQDFRVADGRIYIKTYKYLDSRVKFIILDLDGKLLEEAFLPDIKITLYDIKDNWFYFLKEDEIAEVWELYKVRIPTNSKKRDRSIPACPLKP